MDSTFITILDLSLDANILYCSTSITDILRYRPNEVLGKSCWEYFHPEDVPFARAVHGRGVQLDKAAVLNYCRIRNKRGEWVGCECIFTVVYNVLVGCTSIYMEGPKSHQRAVEAPVVRQLFSSSPRDPRYHMLSYISTKFSSGPKPHVHEPRAALFLNRFTRSLTINFATDGLSKLLGISADELTGKSFYYCIQENCLPEAVRCLESAKANDSIAYLRFWYRDPRLDGFSDQGSDEDESMSDTPSSDLDDDGDGGVHLNASGDSGVHLSASGDGYATRKNSEQSWASDSSASGLSSRNHGQSLGALSDGTKSRSSSGVGTDMGNDSSYVMWDESPAGRSGSSRSSLSMDSSDRKPMRRRRSSSKPQDGPIELEAVVSCSSDGLVVVLRSARPFVPDSIRATNRTTRSAFANGVFASPWAANPIMPQVEPQPCRSEQHSFGPAPSPFDVCPAQPVLSGPPLDDFMGSIREVAVFAWALTGINGSLAQYSRGRPMPGARPYGGMPVWDPDGSMARAQQDGSYDHQAGHNRTWSSDMHTVA